MTLLPSLPGDFSELEPFVDQWAAGRTARRAALRTQSTPQEREAFFVAAAPRPDAALAYLDARSLNALDASEQRLMDLMLALAHVALAVEIQGPDETKSAPWRDRMRIDRSTADREGALCSN